MDRSSGVVVLSSSFNLKKNLCNLPFVICHLGFAICHRGKAYRSNFLPITIGKLQMNFLEAYKSGGQAISNTGKVDGSLQNISVGSGQWPLTTAGVDDVIPGDGKISSGVW
jgi:hypothetical protein